MANMTLDQQTEYLASMFYSSDKGMSLGPFLMG